MIRAAFVRQSRGNLKIPTAFEVHIELDLAIDMHSR